VTTTAFTNLRGLSTYVDSTDPVADHSQAAVAPMLKDVTVLALRIGYGDVPVDASAGTWTLTLTAADDFDGTATIAVKPFDDSWSPAVGFADLPGYFADAPATFTGTISAGDVVELNVTPFASALAGGRDDFGLGVYRTDTGTLGSFFTCLVGDDRAPFLTGDWVSTPDAPTGLLPRSGGIVGEPRPVLSARQPSTLLTAIQVQINSDAAGFVAATGIPTPDYDSGTFTTDVAEFDLDAVDPMDFPDLTETTYFWTMRFQDANGWGDYQTPATFGGYVAKAAATFTSPAGATVSDPNPLFSWTVDGTQVGYEIATYPQGNRLSTADASGYVSSATLSYQTVERVKYGTMTRGTDAGVVLTGSQQMTVELHTFDNVTNRQATPGCPIYSITTADYRFSSDATVPKLDFVRGVQIGSSPFVDLYATTNAGPDTLQYIIWILNGVHIARRPVDKMTYTLSEGTYTYNYRYFGATPFQDGYLWNGKAVIGGDTSDSTDDFLMDTLIVEGYWAGNAEPSSPNYNVVGYCSGEGSTLARSDQAWYAQGMGQQFPEYQYNSKGPIVMSVQGVIRDNFDESATFWEGAWHRLCGNGEIVQTAYLNTAYPAVLQDFVAGPLEGSGSATMKSVSFTSVQMDRQQLFEVPPTDGGETVIHDFETLVSGDATTDGGEVLRETADDGAGSPDVTDVDGTPLYDDAAAIHGLMGVDLGWRL
jgi:hypothetical protein